MSVTTGMSVNDIFCLEKKSYVPGNIVVGNSQYFLLSSNSSEEIYY